MASGTSYSRSRRTKKALAAWVPQLSSEQGSEFDVPPPQGFVTDLDAALVEQFLKIPLAEWEAVVEPEGIPDDAQRKTVAMGLPISHNSPAYPR
ncbi:hypothetical protein GCM10010842_29850 [Deinococcus daejeonensis]|uniref:Uncharacterized protein n=1 Tax=Deinococcus daejeonensis TaxID=1007098 RepID=A0ABQ2JAZ3_9DEIO|nr:hypothetical protein GCM10010842_29850 [Deinococcus daejeonensis]